MAERYERFRIETGPRGPQVVLDQRRNAVGNIIIGASIALGGWLARMQASGVLVGIGLIWVGLAFCALFFRRVLVLGDPLEYLGGRKIRTLPRDEVEVLRVYRKLSGARRRRPPLPWTLEILGADGERPFVEFRFTGEKAARGLAERVAQTTGIPAATPERAVEGNAAET